jgi:hypothetical protein
VESILHCSSDEDSDCGKDLKSMDATQHGHIHKRRD